MVVGERYIRSFRVFARDSLGGCGTCSVRMSESERDDPVGGRGRDPGPPGGQDPGPPGGVVMPVASLRALADGMPKTAEPREACLIKRLIKHATGRDAKTREGTLYFANERPPDGVGNQGPSQCLCSQRGARADAPVSGSCELVSSVPPGSRGGVCRSDRFCTPE